VCGCDLFGHALCKAADMQFLQRDEALLAFLERRLAAWEEQVRAASEFAPEMQAIPQLLVEYYAGRIAALHAERQELS
jgi:hypothetical protein